MIKKLINYFSKFEFFLWLSSIMLMITSFIIFDRHNYLTLFSSLIGVTSLIFNAKGHPVGQILMIIFSIIYGIISFNFAYYGEMLTYVGMTLPMAVIALITWIRNPYEKGKNEVKINNLSIFEIIVMFIVTIIITIIFYFILVTFNTSNIIPSTISVTTSFLAVYLTFRRSYFFPLAYACNDIVLIVLWVLASLESISYISVVVCFIIFLINDLYGFISWKKRKKKQQSHLID